MRVNVRACIHIHMQVLVGPRHMRTAGAYVEATH